MALYSRSIPHQSRAADEIQKLVRQYSQGVTVNELMRSNPDRLKDASSVLAAIELLIEEGKLKSNEPWGGKGFLDEVKLYVPSQISAAGIVQSIHIQNLLSFGANTPPLELRSLN